MTTDEAVEAPPFCRSCFLIWMSSRIFLWLSSGGKGINVVTLSKLLLSNVAKPLQLPNLPCCALIPEKAIEAVHRLAEHLGAN